MNVNYGSYRTTYGRGYRYKYGYGYGYGNYGDAEG